MLRNKIFKHVQIVSGVTANSNNLQTGGGQKLKVLTKHNLQQAVIYNKAQFA